MKRFIRSPRCILSASLAALSIAAIPCWNPAPSASLMQRAVPATLSHPENPAAATARPAGLPESWAETATRTAGRAEYGLRYNAQRKSFGSPNRAQNLRVAYSADGFSLEPRTGDGDSWKLDLRLESIGRDAALMAPGPIADLSASSRVCVEGNRMSVQHDGFRIEYDNGVAGMRQDFIVQRRPDGTGPLAVTLRAAGDLAPRVEGEDDLLFAHPGDRNAAVWYRGLKAWDAAGRELAAHMEASDDLVRLVVDDATAEYPVTVDPLSTTPAWTAEGNQTSAGFGEVANAGDVNNDGYDDVIVGASGYDNGEENEGRAFIYLGSPSGLSPEPAWTAEGNQTSAGFGFSVSGAGDVNGDGYDDVVVGAPNYDNGQTDEGRAFLFYGSAAMSAVPAWTAENDVARSVFGWSVAGVGDVNNDGYDDVIVGAPRYMNGQGAEGRAYLYHGSAAGLSATANWSVESNKALALYGSSVAAAGDVNGDGYADVVVGAENYNNGQVDEGRAFVYHGSAAGLSTTYAWIAENSWSNTFFGHSVAGAGDINGDGYDDLIVSASQYPDDMRPNGRVYLFTGSASGLTANPVWYADPKGFQTQARFGESVSGAGDVNGDGYDDVVIGSPDFNVPSGDGQVAIYHGSASGLPSSPSWSVDGPVGSDKFGSSVTGGGDVNGDGLSDIIVGDHAFSNGQTWEGKTFLFLGAAERTLSGVIVNDLGARIAGATVTVDNSISATTDASGTFRFVGSVSAGTHGISVAAAGYQTARVDLSMPSGDKHVVIGLSAEAPPPQGPYTLCGTVTRQDGNGPALSGASVELIESGSVVYTGSTDSQGRFCSAPFGNGRYQARFSKAGYETVTADLLLDANKQVVISLVPSSLD